MTKFLITSALPYVNGVKHLGNLAGSLLPADIHARFRRQTGHEVLFLCGTDEHGTPAELAAQAAGLPVADYCARQHARPGRHLSPLRPVVRPFLAHVGRANRRLTQEIFRRLDAAGFIEARTIRQAYSPTDGRFLPDRYVVGTCPHCGSPTRAATSAKAARACSTPKTSLAALGDLRRDRHRVPRDPASVPETLGAARAACATGSRHDATGRRWSARSR